MDTRLAQLAQIAFEKELQKRAREYEKIRNELSDAIVAYLLRGGKKIFSSFHERNKHIHT